ncbi:AAA family ATPase [Corynebacterium poyangense]|uniref:PhoH-like protein n=1 Tax=Corynebacterium poyangense TaxID=2684405 RepID=A0A7H0SSF4_9CORY|nr:PhoH family protein [Corynebacterium poyangense]MBZ8178426.1 AAA family ATPase [Corynebacterium poyangense]QNQ91479.1 AAA family ATPase [Corynebacterium poyangense]
MDVVTRMVDVGEDTAPEVAGVHDAHLKIIAEFTGVDCRARGNQVVVRGPSAQVAHAVRALKELAGLAQRRHVLSPDTVRSTLNLVASEKPKSVQETLGEEIIARRGKIIRPKSAGQKDYVSAIDDYTIVFGVGPAGTGKTYLAMAKAVQALKAKEVSRIILTRPAVEAGEKLGFLPGSLNEKIDPYLRPLHDALRDMVEPEVIPRLMESGIIEVAPLAYMRGRTLNDAFVILDEAQNTTPAQMKMFLTRLGFGSTMVVTGDITQVDLPRGQLSGLRVARRILGSVEGIYFAELGSEDVVRHNLVSRIIDAYDQHDRHEAERELAAGREHA